MAKIPGEEMEKKILEAAQELFLEKGYMATSTVDIAQKVGCNQALVHYYFRTKQNLFKQIYLQYVNSLMQLGRQNIQQCASVTELVQEIIHLYFTFFTKYPKVPYFFVNELIVSSEHRQMVKECFIDNQMRIMLFNQLTQLIRNDIQAGKIREINPYALLQNMVSLVLSSFLALPLYNDFISTDEADKQAYLTRREQECIDIILRSLTP